MPGCGAGRGRQNPPRGFKIGASSPLVYRSLQEISTSSDTNGMNFLIAAILRQMNLLIPKGSDKILPGDRVYVVLDQGDNKEILSFMGTYRKPMQNLIIYGGSITGETLASNLEHRNVNVKLIEHDEKRCIELSERLSSTTVLNIPSVNRDLLEAERISDQDAFIAVSNDEEANILSSLLPSGSDVHT